MKFIDKLLEKSEVVAALRAENELLRQSLEAVLLVNNNVIAGVQSDVNSLKDIDEQLNRSVAFRTTLKNVGDIIVKLLDYAKAINMNYQSVLNLKGSIETLDKIVADALREGISETDVAITQQSSKKTKNELN
jgi:hypothetical protein